MSNVMIDIETIGVRPGCTILSIGAVDFSREGVGTETFHSIVSRATCADAGLIEEPQTLHWWSLQSEESRLLLSKVALPSATPIGNALVQLASWLEDLEGPTRQKDIKVWSNGADFDIPILAEAYKRCGLRLPWPVYGARCYRTLKNLIPQIVINRVGEHHNALDDAKSQADHAVRILNELETW